MTFSVTLWVANAEGLCKGIGSFCLRIVVNLSPHLTDPQQLTGISKNASSNEQMCQSMSTVRTGRGAIDRSWSSFWCKVAKQTLQRRFEPQLRISPLTSIGPITQYQSVCRVGTPNPAPAPRRRGSVHVVGREGFDDPALLLTAVSAAHWDVNHQRAVYCFPEIQPNEVNVGEWRATAAAASS